MTETAAATGVRWRVLAPGLWAARGQDRHLGTVQQGRRFTACDADSRTLGAFPTFAEAQDAVVGHRQGPPPPTTGPLQLVAVSVFVCALAGVLAAMRPVLGV